MKKMIQRMMPMAMGLLAVSCNTAEDGDVGTPLPYYSEYGVNTFEDYAPQGGGNRFQEFTDNPFVQTSEQPTSTFSVDADGAAYAIMRRFVNNELKVNPSSVRIEEYLNYFTFDYALPSGQHTVAINGETGPCPWNVEHRLLRLGIKGKELQPSETPQANFVFLVDVSGSMNSQDKLPLLKSGLKMLLKELNANDRISLITYSGNVKKLLESTPVSEGDKIRQAIDKLYASGNTAGGQALVMAYEEALANYDPRCNNRVIMGTDGDFNVGVTNTEELVSLAEEYAAKGIYMTCLGFGLGNLNDEMMEKLSNAGNGTYNYIDSEEEMKKVFVDERERFVSVANDAKCQVTFDSTQVAAYRLIGYENRVISNEDFTDDTKDAVEIGAGQTITALYEIVPRQGAVGAGRHCATFDMRYKKALGGESIALSTDVTLKDGEASVNMTFAAGVAAYGMVLRSSPHRGEATLEMAAQLVEKSLSFDPHGYRKELLGLIRASKE